jgi:hypothetical protein
MENMHMDSMDNFRERLEALEQQTKAMEAHTHTVERRLRRWRGMAGGLLVLGLLSWALPSGKAADAPGRGMAERMAAVENKLNAMAFDDAANEVVITGANLRIVNGLGATDTTNGLGNLIVGYNELRNDPNRPDNRTGSHNVVVGKRLNFSSFGGLVVGLDNEISGQFASVSGGTRNIASGDFSSVSGGQFNTASGERASVSGGGQNAASGPIASISGGALNIASGGVSSVSGGANNTATNDFTWVTGGEFNTASGERASVCGGESNQATGVSASVCGGFRNTASFNISSVSGGVNNTASGLGASVSGGENNTASGNFSSVSGGTNRSAPGPENWAAGALFSNN